MGNGFEAWSRVSNSIDWWGSNGFSLWSNFDLYQRKSQPLIAGLWQISLVAENKVTTIHVCGWSRSSMEFCFPFLSVFGLECTRVAQKWTYFLGGRSSKKVSQFLAKRVSNSRSCSDWDLVWRIDTKDRVEDWEIHGQTFCPYSYLLRG